MDLSIIFKSACINPRDVTIYSNSVIFHKKLSLISLGHIHIMMSSIRCYECARFFVVLHA